MKDSPDQDSPGPGLTRPGLTRPTHPLRTGPDQDSPDQHILLEPDQDSPDQHILLEPDQDSPDQHILLEPDRDQDSPDQDHRRSPRAAHQHEMKEVKPRALPPLPLLLLASSLLLAGVLAQDGAPRRVVTCDADTCFLLIEEALNFTSARDACGAWTGRLATLRSAEQRATARGLLLNSTGGGGGRFWIGLTLPAARLCPTRDAELHGYEWSDRDVRGGGGANVSAWHSVPDRCEDRCVSVSSDGSWRQEPCGGALSGVLCLTQAGWCPAAGVSRVVPPERESALSAGSTRRLHPPGTEVLTVGGGKFLCAWGVWSKAPWICEVLKGGCAHACSDGACTCPAGQLLHADNLTCVDAVAHAEECRQGEPCARENTECAQREPGGRWECACRDGWEVEEELGACVDVSVCRDCEHLKCVKVAGVYTCACNPGFAVSPEDPARCEPTCDREACPAAFEAGKCRCPVGYICDETQNNGSWCVDVDECRDEMPCDDVCVNTYGNYTCLCHPGYRMHDMRCVSDPTTTSTTSSSTTTTSTTSSSTTTTSTPLSAAAGVPPYVRVGSALGMSVFVAVGVALAYLLLRLAHRRCMATFEVPPLDLLTLQQVTTEKYQRFDFDKQSQRADGQRLDTNLTPTPTCHHHRRHQPDTNTNLTSPQRHQPDTNTNLTSPRRHQPDTNTNLTSPRLTPT
ncbi:hypothetical protein CRUP_021691 [Coryphaenoides rupestris]|nr:hypothetical protein CRUP_021691 [Coryphaenoides rupestris]